MTVPLLDLKAQYAAIKADVDAAIAEVFESQHFILGPKVSSSAKKPSRRTQHARTRLESHRAATPCWPA
jgi:hypothetical protein